MDRARSAGAPVIWVQHFDSDLPEGSEEWEYLREWGSPIGPAAAIASTSVYWRFADAPGREGDTIPAVDVAFTAP